MAQPLLSAWRRSGEGYCLFCLAGRFFGGTITHLPITIDDTICLSCPGVWPGMQRSSAAHSLRPLLFRGQLSAGCGASLWLWNSKHTLTLTRCTTLVPPRGCPLVGESAGNTERTTGLFRTSRAMMEYLQHRKAAAMYIAHVSLCCCANYGPGRDLAVCWTFPSPVDMCRFGVTE